MGRKIAIFLIFLSSVALFGCSTDTGYTLEERIDTLIGSSDHHDSRFQHYTGVTREASTWRITSTDATIPLGMQSSMVRIHNDTYTKSQFVFDGMIEDPDFFDSLQLSGNLFVTKDDESVFVKTDDLSIDLGSGNAESMLISLILDSVKGKRLLLDTDNTLTLDSLPHTANVLSLGANVSQQLTRSGAVGVSGNTIFVHPLTQIIGLIYDAFGYQYTDIYIPDYSVEAVDGDEESFEIMIQAMDKKNNIQNMITLGDSYLQFKLLNNDGDEITYERKHNKTLESELTLVIQKDQKNFIDTTVTVQSVPSGDEFALRYKGTIGLSYPRVDDPTNVIDIDILGSYSLRESDDTNAPVPENYILFDQFFGDDYNLPNILGQ